MQKVIIKDMKDRIIGSRSSEILSKEEEEYIKRCENIHDIGRAVNSLVNYTDRLLGEEKADTLLWDLKLFFEGNGIEFKTYVEEDEQ